VATSTNLASVNFDTPSIVVVIVALRIAEKEHSRQLLFVADQLPVRVCSIFNPITDDDEGET